MHLKSEKDWVDLKKKGNLPNNLPPKPQICKQYKNQWKGWADFLGKEEVSENKK